MEKFIFITKPTDKAQAAETLLRDELAKQPFEPEKPIVFAIGGDGTMLHAIKGKAHDEVNFVGISAGRLGFLQTVDPEQIPDLVVALASKKFSIIKAPLLYAKSGGQTLGHAFNDVVVERTGSRAANIKLTIDSSTGSFIGDGIIFATPLGSTAYSLAAGGPVIDSDAEDVFLATPSNPHMSILYSSLQRPHVFSKSRRITVNIDPEDAVDRPVQLTIDGQVALSEITQPVEIALSHHFVHLIELEDGGFRNRIEQKRLGRH